MLDVMLDLETMGNGPNAAIVAIGAVEFDIEEGKLGREYYDRVDLVSSVAAGGVMDALTVLWWMKQGDVAREELHGPGRRYISPALDRFREWLRGCARLDDLRVWGNGAAFDNVILAEAYKRDDPNRMLPWNWWNNRCYRTMKNARPDIEIERGGTHHKAIDDALAQARHLLQILEVMTRGE
jgi:exodeoxyribonuclease VIII